MQRYLIGLAAWLSQGVNAIVLGGHHDMTVSARAWVEQDDPAWGVAYRTLNFLFFWQDDHCYESFLADLEFALEVQRWNRR